MTTHYRHTRPPVLSEGHTALITGGGGGIGGAILRAIVAEGGRVVVVDREESIARAESGWRHEGLTTEHVSVITGDVTSEAFCNRAIDEAVSMWGRLDTLVNAAGITRDKTLRKMELEDFKQVIDVNLNSYFLTCRAVARYWSHVKDQFPIERRRGWSIVNISSVIGTVGNVGQANYASSKWGVIGLSKVIALELARIPVRCNVICPGFTHTPMTDKLPQEAKDRVHGIVPMQRMAESWEIAEMVLFAASPRASYMTGATLVVDGGFSAQ